MADTPIFKLYSNQAVTVTLPAFEKQRQVLTSATYLTFEGRGKPTGFRSPSVHEEWPLVAIFRGNDRVTAVAFMSMLTTAYNAPDGRLIMTPGGLQTTYVDRVVEVHDFVEDIERPSGITRVSFTAIEVYS